MGVRNRSASTVRRFACATLVTTLVVASLLAGPASASGADAAWHMDERSGSRMIDSAANHDGRRVNVAIARIGFRRTAYSFNGFSSRVTVPSSSAFNPGVRNFTVRVHVKFWSRPYRVDSYDLIRKGVCCKQWWKVEIHRAGQASCTFKGAIRRLQITKGPDLSDGRWHTITCQRSPRSIRLVVDGRTFSLPGSVGNVSNTNSLTLGYKLSPRGGGQDWYQGVMDEVVVTKD